MRVRRGSQYRTLEGEDNAEGGRNDTTGRPRSRTLASLYRSEVSSPTASPVVTSPVEELPSERRRAQSDAEAGGSSEKPDLPREYRPYDSVRVPSKIADSILSKKRSSQAVRAQRSLEPLWRRTESSDGQILHGSQADIVVPGDGRPGRLESALSLSSAGEEEDPFRSSSDSLDHHDDDIVEHLEVIGE